MKFFLFTIFAVLFSTAASLPVDAKEKKHPNFVIFLADDLGWGDLACYGNPLIKTPNLDAFAKQGMQFTQCYSAGAVCSPSRSAILTGRTPYRNGVFTWIPENREVHLRRSELTIATLLKQRGYTTCHVGKWHLNGFFNDPRHPQPNDHGYDWWVGTQNNAAPSHAQPTNFLRNGKPVGKVDGYSAPFIVDEAIAWLKQERDSRKPFLLSVWTHEPHFPIASAPEFKAQYPDLTDPEQIEHHANITQIDDAFGKLIKALDELNLSGETFVFFTSDNGPAGKGNTGAGRGSTGGLRARKGTVYEGGIRVPGIARWPGKIPAGKTSNEPLIGSDLFSTLCDIAGIQAPRDRVIDGGSILPAFKGKTIQRDRPLYWRYRYTLEPMKIAFRDGGWKLLSDETLTHFELYNLKTDWQEQNDLSQSEPKRFEKMKTSLQKLNAEIEAEGPDWWKTFEHGTVRKK